MLINMYGNAGVWPTLHFIYVGEKMLENTMTDVAYLEEIAILKKQLEDKKALLHVRDTSIQTLHHNIEKLLRKCKDLGVIKSWYYDGDYHWEEANEQ